MPAVQVQCSASASARWAAGARMMWYVTGPGSSLVFAGVSRATFSGDGERPRGGDVDDGVVISVNAVRTRLGTVQYPREKARSE